MNCGGSDEFLEITELWDESELLETGYSVRFVLEKCDFLIFWYYLEQASLIFLMFWLFFLEMYELLSAR